MRKIIMSFLAVILAVALGIFIAKWELQGDVQIINNNTGLASNSVIFVDKEEDVMYLLQTVGGDSGMTMMLTPEGNPKLSTTTTYNTRGINRASKILVDSENGVMYLFGIYDSGINGLVVMYDRNNTPRLSKDSGYEVTKIENLGTKEGRESIYKIFVDDETGVMYLMCRYLGNVGITMMVNPDGSPKLNTDTKYKTESIEGNKIYTDSKTNIMYLSYSRTSSHTVSVKPHVRSSSREGDMVMMANVDGTPRTSDTTAYETVTMDESKKTMCVGSDKENGVRYMFYRGGGLTTVMETEGFPKTK